MRKSMKRKLSLHRETLRLLQSDVLRVARGAGPTVEVDTTCACTDGCGGGGTGSCHCGSGGCGGTGGGTGACTIELVTTCVC